MVNTLKGKIFITTRPKGHSTELAEMFQKAEASLLEFPCIQINPTELSSNEIDLLHKIDQFNWVAFTSANGVVHFFEQFNKNEIYPYFTHLQFAAIGHKTAEALHKLNYKSHLLASESSSLSLGKLLTEKLPHGSKVLLALGTLAHNQLQEQLSHTMQVSRINVYETLTPNEFDPEIKNRIFENKYDQLFFTSPSGIKNFLNLFPINFNPSLLKSICIGSTTAEYALKNGIKPSAISDYPSNESLFQCILNLYN